MTAKDGFANIRNEHLEKSGKTLKTGTVVFWDHEYDGPGYLDGWYKIAYTNDAFSNNADESGTHLKSGLVHKSQVTTLFVSSPADQKSFSMKYDLQKFNFSNKKIIYGEGKDYIKKDQLNEYYKRDVLLKFEKISTENLSFKPIKPLNSSLFEAKCTDEIN